MQESFDLKVTPLRDTPFSRWEKERTKCLPDLCWYTDNCPIRRWVLRERWVHQRDCFRFRPEFERPPKHLPRNIARLLESYRREKVAPMLA